MVGGIKHVTRWALAEAIGGKTSPDPGSSTDWRVSAPSGRCQTMKKVVVKPQATGTIRALLGERKLVIGLLVGFALLSVAYNRSSEIMYAGELIRHQASPLSDPSVGPGIVSVHGFHGHFRKLPG